MRGRDVVEFLGVWEQLHNPDFNRVQFEAVKNEAGLNRFVMTPSKWIEQMNSIGIVSKSGRYGGGTYAHSDIALEFASWISAEFKLYIMKDYQRLKKDENSRLSLNWNLNREIAKLNYRIHTDAIKDNLIPPELTPDQISYKYANEADLLNVALFGMTAKQWREKNSAKTGNIRDDATLNQLLVLATTSANECEAIKKYGILDLKQAYLCVESELRVFLDRHGIIINIEGALLTYKGKAFDISYNAGNCPRTDTQEYLCWSIGRKFYYDFTTCGFLSVWERSPYGGQVHCRPEILWDIDNLLGLKLSEEWEQSHFLYEIVAQVNGFDIVFDGDDDQSDKDKVLMYLTMAYDTAFGEPFENILLMKNGIQISPDRIIEIKPLTCWRSSKQASQIISL